MFIEYLNSPLLGRQGEFCPYLTKLSELRFFGLLDDRIAGITPNHCTNSRFANPPFISLYVYLWNCLIVDQLTSRPQTVDRIPKPHTAYPIPRTAYRAGTNFAVK